MYSIKLSNRGLYLSLDKDAYGKVILTENLQTVYTNHDTSAKIIKEGQDLILPDDTICIESLEITPLPIITCGIRNDELFIKEYLSTDIFNIDIHVLNMLKELEPNILLKLKEEVLRHNAGDRIEFSVSFNMSRLDNDFVYYDDRLIPLIDILIDIKTTTILENQQLLVVREKRA